MKNFKAKIESCVEIARDVIELRFKKIDDGAFEFKAGQFLMLSVPGYEKIVKRAYSIASAPKETRDGHFKFAIKLLENGMASNFVRTLKGGEEVDLTGPLGHFKLDDQHDGPILLVGTGTGLAPLRSMILEALSQDFKNNITLFFGVRTEQNLFWHQEFRELERKHNNFIYHHTLSRADENWSGNQGRVTKLGREFQSDFSSLHVYLCGSLPMVNEMTEIMLEKDVPKENIKKEVY